MISIIFSKNKFIFISLKKGAKMMIGTINLLNGIITYENILLKNYGEKNKTLYI